MTPKALISIAVAGTSLALGVQGAMAGHPPDAFERAVAQKQGLAPTAGSKPDAFERAVAANLQGLLTASGYYDSVESAIAAGALPAAPPTNSGTEIEWTQIGIGFGLGTILMLSLWLGLQATRKRPPIHR